MSTPQIQAAIDMAKLQLLKLNVIAEVHARGNLAGIEVDDLIRIIKKHAPALQINLTEEILNEAVLMVRMEIDVIGGKSAVSIDGESDHKKWYTRDFLKKGGFWDRFNKYINSPEKRLPTPVIKQLDEDTDEIVSRLGNPNQAETFKRRGMVFGDVQAGKTMNYSAVINKACDAGYKVIIVLSGTTESLRSQTQERLDYDFVGEISTVGNQVAHYAKFVGVGNHGQSLRLICRTDVDSDFKNHRGFSIDSVKQPILIVAKKNPSPLKEIINWLDNQNKQNSKKVSQPVFIIDDEADNASVNAGKEKEDPKTINHLIRQIIDRCDKVSYVGYTATPFANIFISPDDSYDRSDLVELFPKDFIVSINPPSNYCGGKFYFIDEITSEYALCYIEDADACFPKNEPLIGVPKSLKSALMQFFITSAIKDDRREKGLTSKTGDGRFDSMLINVAIKTSSQNDLKPAIKDLVDSIYEGISSNQSLERLNTLMIDLKKIFEDKFSPFLGSETQISWAQVYERLKKLEKPVVLSINTKSTDRLNWKQDAPSKVIAIGGFTLSRGITLSGLTISYIFRNSKAFDTILQMGRWFGYRDGYRDLVRLWVESDFSEAFDRATRASDDLRNDIIQMNRLKMTPSQFGMKVSTYPGLLPTAKNKMQTGEIIEMKVNFSGTKPEVHCFFVDDDIEKKNEIAVVNFTNELVGNYSSTKRFVIDGDKEEIGSAQIVFEGVDSSSVVELIKQFHFHPANSLRIGESFFKQYIEEMQFGKLKSWDVVYYSRPKNKVGRSEKISQILGVDINLQPRSVFTAPYFHSTVHDKTAIHLTANRTVTPGGAATLVTDKNRPTLLIQALRAGEYRHKKGDPTDIKIPDHLLNVEGKEYISLKIYFPDVDKTVEAFSFVATKDYLERLKREQSDESEAEE
jgi:hypothetical protein